MESTSSRNRERRYRHLSFNVREAGILLSLAIICSVTAIVNPVFIGTANLIDVLRSTSFTLISAVGMTFVLISAGIDLSVGSVIGLSGMITGYLLVKGFPVAPAVLIGLGSGMSIGFVNGAVIMRFGIPPLIVTLGTMNIARGIVYVLSKGRPYYPFPASFNAIGQGSIFGVPVAIYLAIAIAAIAHFVLEHTVFGREVFAIGGNEEASRVAGINVRRVKVIIYCIAAVAAGATGILMAARLSSSQAAAGNGWEMTVIASVIIGGTSMFGGSGSILGTAIGTAIMSVLTNAMVLMRVDVYWQKIFVGSIIILAVGLDTYRRSMTTGGGR